jgi:tRNA G18 (ribose-2'-O)-methylase SpoU
VGSAARQAARRSWLIRSAIFVYGLHAVGAVIERAPERLLELWMAEPRDDARARDLKERAEAAGVHRCTGAATIAGQAGGRCGAPGRGGGNAALKPWDEHDLLA